MRIDDLNWPSAEFKLKQLISLYVRSGIFPEEMYGEELIGLRLQLESGKRDEKLYEKIMNYRV